MVDQCFRAPNVCQEDITSYKQRDCLNLQEHNCRIKQKQIQQLHVNNTNKLCAPNQTQSEPRGGQLGRLVISQREQTMGETCEAEIL